MSNDQWHKHNNRKELSKRASNQKQSMKMMSTIYLSTRTTYEPHPTKKVQVSMTQSKKHRLSAWINEFTTIHPKPHAHVILTQIKIKEGLQKFCWERKWTDYQRVMTITRTRSTNARKKGRSKRVLVYLMFLLEKHGGSIKAKWCADGRLWQEYTKKD